MNISLHDLLSYKNEKILQKYSEEYPNSSLSPQEAFTELMKYMWLCHKHAFDKANLFI